MEPSMNRLDRAPVSSKPGARNRRAITVMFGCALLMDSPCGFGQITSGTGSDQQENRTSSMGTTPDPASTALHESNAPQAKEARGNARGKSAGKDGKTGGAGGFENGLYGTGAGSNK
jgi:hypothetical protein